MPEKRVGIEREVSLPIKQRGRVVGWAGSSGALHHLHQERFDNDPSAARVVIYPYPARKDNSDYVTLERWQKNHVMITLFQFAGVGKKACQVGFDLPFGSAFTTEEVAAYDANCGDGVAPRSIPVMITGAAWTNLQELLAKPTKAQVQIHQKGHWQSCKGTFSPAPLKISPI